MARIAVCTDKDEYLEGLLSEIWEAREQSKNHITRINAKITTEVAIYIEEYFSSFEHYTFEIKFCMNCKNQCDIRIEWSY